MSVLIGKEITKALKDGLIRIEPLDKSQIGPGSIDLTLGNDFRTFRKQTKLYHVKNHSDFQDITRAVHVKDGGYIVIRPGEMVLGITKEKITLADHISGRLEGRSRFARFGLAVHVTAGFMHPGISNHQVLEIVNLGHGPLALYPRHQDLPVHLRAMRRVGDLSGEIRQAGKAVTFRRPTDRRTKEGNRE